jgi:hypothetical protein
MAAINGRARSRDRGPQVLWKCLSELANTHLAQARAGPLAALAVNSHVSAAAAADVP